jgi:hypothetical protein
VEPGYGNAATLSKQAEQREVKRACRPSHPPTSHLLGAASTLTGRDTGSFLPLGVMIVAGAVLLSGVAALLRRRRTGDTPKQGPLERFGVVLAACATVATLLLQVVPGITAHPPPEATLTVAKVHARITLGDYARLVDVKPPKRKLEQRRVGDVVWLQMSLKGFKDKGLHLRYGLFDLDPAAGGALLPGTANDVFVERPSRDGERVLTPVWVGYPKSHRFRAEFWLLAGGGVQAITSTGGMAGSAYRYAC